jgi:hypothetical protein
MTCPLDPGDLGRVGVVPQRIESKTYMQNSKANVLVKNSLMNINIFCKHLFIYPFNLTSIALWFGMGEESSFNLH